MEYFDRSSPCESNLTEDCPGCPMGGPLGNPMGIPMGGPVGGLMGGPMGGPTGATVGVAASTATPAIADPSVVAHLGQAPSVGNESRGPGDLASVGGVASRMRSHGLLGRSFIGWSSDVAYG